MWFQQVKSTAERVYVPHRTILIRPEDQNLIIVPTSTPGEFRPSRNIPVDRKAGRPPLGIYLLQRLNHIYSNKIHRLADVKKNTKAGCYVITFDCTHTDGTRSMKLTWRFNNFYRDDINSKFLRTQTCCEFCQKLIVPEKEVLYHAKQLGRRLKREKTQAQKRSRYIDAVLKARLETPRLFEYDPTTITKEQVRDEMLEEAIKAVTEATQKYMDTTTDYDVFDMIVQMPAIGIAIAGRLTLVQRRIIERLKSDPYLAIQPGTERALQYLSRMVFPRRRRNDKSSGNLSVYSSSSEDDSSANDDDNGMECDAREDVDDEEDEMIDYKQELELLKKFDRSDDEQDEDEEMVH